MVDSSATMVPLPLHFTQKILSSINSAKNGKNDDEKTFNYFQRYVRQLVDQYLDKEVVISKQPEDKVELIVQACREKFPEFAHWTTTRIRIYIESCRRLKKIKNSPILLAKRKAAGRRFREGQKLKKIISTQFTMQATESQRHLAEYILKSNQVPVKEEPVTMLTKDSDFERNAAFKSVYTNPTTSLLSTSTEYVPARLGSLDNINTALSSIIQLSPQLLKVQQSLSEASVPPQIIPSFLARTSPQLSSLPTSNFLTTSLPTSNFLPTSLPSSNFLPTSLPSTNFLPTCLPSTNFTTGLVTSLSTGAFQLPSSPSSCFSSRVTSPTSVTSTTSPVMASSHASLEMSPMNVAQATPPASSPLSSYSPLKPTITLPNTHVSPVLSDSVISSTINISRNTSFGENRNPFLSSISPKQKSFQIDSLMKPFKPQPLPDKPMIHQNTDSTITDTQMSQISQMLDRPLFPTGEMSMSEILNAKTLVTSYREAANFLYRAATELEQLLPNDHRVF